MKTREIFGCSLREDAALWGVSARAAWAVFLFPLVGGLALVLTRLDWQAFLWLTDEDSILEWSQVALFLAGGLLGLLAARSLWTTGGRSGALIVLLFVVFCVAAAGEEISWGQRVLGLETPDRLEEANAQGELNAHNILEVRVALKFAMIGLGLYGFVAPWLVSMGVWRLDPRLRLAVPPVFSTSAFFVVATYNLGRLVLFPHGFFGLEENTTVVRLGEWSELCLSLALAFYGLLLWRRVRAKATDERVLDVYEAAETRGARSGEATISR